MRIIVDDRVERKYYDLCLAEINKAYPDDIEYSEKDIIVDICNKCITLLTTEFRKEVFKYTNYNDLLFFLWLYSTDQIQGEDRHITLQMCRYIFTLIPSMELDSISGCSFDSEDSIDFSDLYFITKLIDLFCQQLTLARYLPNHTWQLERGDYGFAITYKDSAYADTHERLNFALKQTPIRKQCTSLAQISDFCNILNNAYGSVADDFLSSVTTIRSPYINLNEIPFEDFIKLLDGTFQEEKHKSDPLFFTDLYNRFPKSDFLAGLTLTDNYASLETAISKPYNINCRTRFRPIICFNIDGKQQYISTPKICIEAIDEIIFNMLPFRELPKEWGDNPTLKTYAKKLFNEHDKWLENPIETILTKKGVQFHRNIKAINNISLEKAPAFISSIEYRGKKVGEIDFLALDMQKKVIYVIDAKLMKTRFHFQSFSIVKDHFTGEKGYEQKLYFKIDWVSRHLSDISKSFRIDCSGFNIKGLFVTETFVYHSLYSSIPIIPLEYLEEYLESGNRLCFLCN